MTVVAQYISRARPLEVLLLLAGLFAMHGLSTEHTAPMPGPTVMPPMSMIAMTGLAAHQHPGAATAGQVTTTSFRVMPGMNHSECLAAPRHNPGMDAPAFITTVAAAAADPATTAIGSPSAPPRAPPQPDLSQLCISRT